MSASTSASRLDVGSATPILDTFRLNREAPPRAGDLGIDHLGGGAGIGSPPPPPGIGATRMDPPLRSRARLTLPFAVIAVIGVSRMVIGAGWGLLPLLTVGPAVAAAAGCCPPWLRA